MKNYKAKKDSKEEGTSSDFGAIYNWQNMYKVVQSANIMIEEVANVEGTVSRRSGTLSGGM